MQQNRRRSWLQAPARGLRAAPAGVIIMISGTDHRVADSTCDSSLNYMVMITVRMITSRHVEASVTVRLLLA